MDLALDDHRIDEPAEIVDGHIAFDGDVTGVRIDLGLDEMAAVGEREGLRIVIGGLFQTRLQALGIIGRRVGTACDFGEGEHGVAQRHAEDAVLELDLGGVAVKHVGGDHLHL